MSESIVIVSAARTPMGSFQGDFASLSAHDLGGVPSPPPWRVPALTLPWSPKC